MKETDKIEQIKPDDITIPDIEEALDQEYYRRDYHNAIRSTIYVLITVAAIALLIATLVLPVIRIYSSAMEPTIADDSIILCRKTKLPDRGDVFAFYYNNKILVRRVIALPGDTIEVEGNGRVTVNGERQEETYTSGLSLGSSDLEYPYTVPEGKYFVLADNREGTVDSRNSLFGCIQEEDFIGKTIIKAWPFDKIGLIK